MLILIKPLSSYIETYVKKTKSKLAFNNIIYMFYISQRTRVFIRYFCLAQKRTVIHSSICIFYKIFLNLKNLASLLDINQKYSKYLIKMLRILVKEIVIIKIFFRVVFILTIALRTHQPVLN